jgi:hypothetical protein
MACKTGISVVDPPEVVDGTPLSAVRDVSAAAAGDPV